MENKEDRIREICTETLGKIGGALSEATGYAISEGYKLGWEECYKAHQTIIIDACNKNSKTINEVSDDIVTISKDRYEQLLQYEQEYTSRQSMINSFIQNE